MSFITQPLPSLSAWVHFYAHADLPVLQRTAVQLAKFAQDQDNISPREIVAVVVRDPLMTLKTLIWIGVLKAERMKLKKSLGLMGEIETVEAAIVMMGVAPFFSKFGTLETVENKLKEIPSARLGVLRVMARGVNAADYAGDWAAYRKDLDIQILIEAALLHDSVELLTWVFAPALALRLKEMRDKFPTMRSQEMQRQILGITLNELEVGLFKEWNLPSLVQRLSNELESLDPQVCNVALAAKIARHMANGSDDPALPDDFIMLGKLLNISPEVARQRIIQEKTKET